MIERSCNHASLKGTLPVIDGWRVATGILKMDNSFALHMIYEKPEFDVCNSFTEQS